jgi:hypothetical protein
MEDHQFLVRISLIKNGQILECILRKRVPSSPRAAVGCSACRTKKRASNSTLFPLSVMKDTDVPPEPGSNSIR